MAVSTTSEERASAFKNIAMAHFLQLKALSQDSSTPFSSTWKHCVSRSVRAFVEAFRHGVVDGGKPSTWSDDLLSSFDSLVHWISETSASLLLFRSPLMQTLCDAIDDCQRDLFHSLRHQPLNATVCLAYKSYAQALFDDTLTLRTPDDEFVIDHRKCSSLLQDASLALRKGQGFLDNLDMESDRVRSLSEDVRHLTRSVEVHLCICEAQQYICSGDEALQRAVMREERIEMGYVEDALDYYRSAARATKEMDVETEAIALSRAGNVYADTLKMENVAQTFYFRAVSLALTVMSPRISRSEWYKKSLKKVKEHQQRVAEEEKLERERSRESAKVRLMPKLSKLAMEAKKSAESFLRYLYAEHAHPDVKRNVVPVLDTKGSMAKSLKTAILHYHPDSNVRFGDEWKLLCDEICKHLNSKYELLK